MNSLSGLESGLLVLESILLVVTIALLTFSIKEGRARDKLISEVGRATKMLSRQEYFVTLTDYMLDSEKEIVGFITGRLPIGEDTKRTGAIINNIKKMVKAGVKVRYILPQFHDRRYLGWLYTQAGAEIRYGGSPLVNDLRYTVVDGKVSIIGIPESIGRKQATKKGYFVPSEGLSTILLDHFNRIWEGGVPYEKYMEGTLDFEKATPEELAEELSMDEPELE
jgi:hypothetical protein